MDDEAIRYPDETLCVECGRTLAPGTLECPECFGPPGPRDDLRHREIERLLRRSKARLVFGLIFLGWVLPLAFWSANQALALYRQEALNDGRLLARIQWHRYLPVVALVTWAGLWILFLVQSPSL